MSERVSDLALATMIKVMDRGTYGERILISELSSALHELQERREAAERKEVKLGEAISALMDVVPILDLQVSEHNDGDRLRRRICEFLKECGYPGWHEQRYLKAGMVVADSEAPTYGIDMSGIPTEIVSVAELETMGGLGQDPGLLQNQQPPLKQDPGLYQNQQPAPPLGVMPRSLWEETHPQPSKADLESRMEDLVAAIRRRHDAGVPFTLHSAAWSIEYSIRKLQAENPKLAALIHEGRLPDTQAETWRDRPSLL